MHASGKFVEKTDPELALTLFPLDADARANVVERMLDGQTPQEELPAVKAALDEALLLNAGHARLQSLRSEVELRLGDRDGAAAGFQHALRLSKTESAALQRMIGWSVERQDVAGALQNIDLLLRRHSGKIKELGGVFAELVSTREGYEELRRRLAAGAPWRGAVFRQIAAEPASLAAGASLLIDLRESGNAGPDWEVSAIIQALLRDDRPIEAYNLFLETQSDAEIAVGGYIHDSGFETAPSGKPFDWQFRSRSGHTISRLPNPAFGTETSGLLIQFNGTPVKDMQVSQVLHLPPGHYDLDAEISAANAKLPKGLYWSLRCLSPARELARLSIPEGSYRDDLISTSFQLPAVGCPLQSISIHTNVIAESWKDRYIGSVVIRRLQIRKGLS